MNEIEEFFNSIGLHVAKVWKDEFNCYCPFHEDDNASLNISPARGVYNCFAGCVRGSGGIGPLLKKLGAGYDIQFLSRFPQFIFYEEEEEEEGVINDIDVDSLPYAELNEYLRRRYITNETIEEFSIKYHVGFDALVVPINDRNGKQVGYIRRNLSSEPKYMNSKGMDVSNLLFPLDKLDDSNESVVIVEGIFDAIRANQEGIKGVATLGGEIKKRQLRLLGEFTNNIVLCPDRDKEGVRLAEKNVNLLEKYGFTVSIAKPSGVAKDLAESIKVDLQIIPKYLLNFNQKSIGNFIGVV